ncbi:hypothetical protein TWF694_005134 [Orbilia ellipsospora]|uniref:Uncharacterized protein n=1 Tax=Orbilia ellipsospora TaxID=2528407 RepID=A0AAV9X0T4_9PEZI
MTDPNGERGAWKDGIWGQFEYGGNNINAEEIRKRFNDWANYHKTFGDEQNFCMAQSWPDARGECSVWEDDIPWSGATFEAEPGNEPVKLIKDASEPKKGEARMDAETAKAKRFPNGSFKPLEAKEGAKKIKA